MAPLRHGPPELFPIVSRFLRAAGYEEPALLAQFGIADLHDLLFPYGLRREAVNRLYEGEGAVKFLARLLMGGFTVSVAEAGRHAPLQVLTALETLGVVERIAEGRLRAPVILFPTRGLLMASDRPMYADGERAYQGPDYVMSGLEPLCRSYVDMLPQTPCGDFLDLGTGSGVAALCAAGYARGVWASDITARAAGFAEFNRLLNGAGNVTVVEGDLFAPFGDRRFDRIASNPPFEPPLKQNMIFSVGGEDGEAILARLIAAVPQHLEPGGRLYCLVSGTDRLKEPFDRRIRRWLGGHSDTCDVALFVRQKLTPREYAVEQILGENADSWKIEEWSRFYQRLEAVRVILGMAVIQRAAGDRAAFHVRHDLAPGAGSREMERLLAWETQCAQADMVERILASKPRAAAGWKLNVGHAFDGSALAVEQMSVSREAPFEVTLDCNESLPRLLCLCDGSRTGAGLFEWLEEKGAVSGRDAVAPFARQIGDLISAGFLEI